MDTVYLTQIVGERYNDSTTTRSRPLIWENGNMKDLGFLNSTFYSGRANDINDKGAVVGVIVSGQLTKNKAVLWENGNIKDLNNYIDPTFVQQGWKLLEATSINNNGWIVGWGKEPTLRDRAFLLKPR